MQPRSLNQSASVTVMTKSSHRDGVEDFWSSVHAVVPLRLVRVMLLKCRSVKMLGSVEQGLVHMTTTHSVMTSSVPVPHCMAAVPFRPSCRRLCQHKRMP
mmetsp:Transcript_38952/g.86646  ORF Transcript_38952/g.86646 Transcript_38952/m.86646 type:complete len:100 (+) Transcript_38952:547-846(+)